MLSADEQLKRIFTPHCDDYPRGDLRRKLELGTPLRVKYGIDPTGKDIHLGHTVALRRLRAFQDMGHTAIIIIGNFTATIGDPTGRDKMRPPMTCKEVDENASTYPEQIGKIIDIKKAEIHYNNEWFDSFNLYDILNLISDTTLPQMLTRNDFHVRMEDMTTKKPIYMQELLYPFLQAWDSYEVKADVEIGGTEQMCTLMLARDIQKQNKQAPQTCFTVPLLRGLDGVKRMGKSLGNYIAVTESAYDMFAKIMSIPDSLISEWFDLLTDLKGQVRFMPDGAMISPMQTKKALAVEIVRFYHGAEKEETARLEWFRVFSEKKDPTDIQEITIASKEITDGKIWVCRLLTALKLTSSNNEARRLIVPTSGVTIGEDKITDPNMLIPISNGLIVRVGSRKIAKVKVD